MRATRNLCAFIFLALAAVTGASAQNSAGSVNFVMRTTSAFDQFTYSPASSVVSWMNQKFWRLQTVSPYWDSRLSWYRNAWAYNDLYSTWVGNGNSVVQQHPDWILKDQYGNWLYIPFACNGSSCPQWALDPGNPAVRSWWINNVRQQLAQGYRGIWIDDANLDWRTGDGAGNIITPMDVRTGQLMNYSAWQGYVVGFLQAVRQAFPNVEIVHNSVWYSGGPQRDYNPYVIQQIQACDYINVERGVDDQGLTGGTGVWSLQAMLSYVDHVHSLGKHVIFDEYNYYGDYQTAGYFLISSGGDAIGNQVVTPYNWWSGYDVQLGNANGARYMWNGLIRRDFQNGMVLLNPPQSSTVSVNLPGTFQRDDGSWVSSVTLGASQGAVLMGGNTPSYKGNGLNNGVYTIQNTASQLLLDDPAYSQSNGTQMIQWNGNGGSNQQWQITSNGNGYYTIQNAASGLYLTSPGSGGQGVTQQNGNGNDSQLWAINSSGSGYSIQNKASGMAIDNPAASKNNGTGIIVWSPNGGPNQTWSIH